MAQKLTINDAIYYAAVKGGKCLSKVYKNNRTKLLWECSEGHVWEAPISGIKRGGWCRKCLDYSKRISIERIKAVVKAHGGQYIHEGPVVSRSKIKWKCKNNHIWAARVNDVMQGTWCKECFVNNSKLSIDLAHELAKKNKGKCLSAIYINNYTPLEWKCEYNHTWKASISSIKGGSWCGHCATYYSIDEVNDIVNDVGGKLISIGGDNIIRMTTIEYICGNNHRCTIRLRNLIDGHGCIQCKWDSQKSSLDKMIEMANSKGGECVSKEYIGSGVKLEWKCEIGHTWEARPSDIKRGSWCPKCYTKTQSLLVKIIKEIFPNYKVEENFRGLDWLVNPNTGRKLEMDIYVKKLYLGIEYDGEQHFNPVTFGNITKAEAESKLKYTKKMDKIKNKKIKEHRKDIKYFIRFNYREKNKLTKEYVVSKLIKNGISTGEIK